jgi:hypothetical protein
MNNRWSCPAVSNSEFEHNCPKKQFHDPKQAKEGDASGRAD